MATRSEKLQPQNEPSETDVSEETVFGYPLSDYRLVAEKDGNSLYGLPMGSKLALVIFANNRQFRKKTHIEAVVAENNSVTRFLDKGGFDLADIDIEQLTSNNGTEELVESPLAVVNTPNLPRGTNLLKPDERAITVDTSILPENMTETMDRERLYREVLNRMPFPHWVSGDLRIVAALILQQMEQRGSELADAFLGALDEGHSASVFDSNGDNILAKLVTLIANSAHEWHKQGRIWQLARQETGQEANEAAILGFLSKYFDNPSLLNTFLLFLTSGLNAEPISLSPFDIETYRMFEQRIVKSHQTSIRRSAEAYGKTVKIRDRARRAASLAEARAKAAPIQLSTREENAAFVQSTLRGFGAEAGGAAAGGVEFFAQFLIYLIETSGDTLPTVSAYLIANLALMPRRFLKRFKMFWEQYNKALAKEIGDYANKGDDDGTITTSAKVRRK